MAVVDSTHIQTHQSLGSLVGAMERNSGREGVPYIDGMDVVGVIDSGVCGHVLGFGL